MKVLSLAVLGLAVVSACGDDNDDQDATNQRVRDIESVSKSATLAWINQGAEGFFDYLTTDMKSVCSLEEVETVLSSNNVNPRGWGRIEVTHFEGGSGARGTVTLMTDAGETEQEWFFERDGDAWRISGVPGLVDCASI